jgi:hypothetical protein
MQIPAYCPIVLGVNDDDQRELVVDVTNTMGIGPIPAIVSDDDVGMDIEAPSVAVGPMSIEFMSILAIWRVY